MSLYSRLRRIRQFVRKRFGRLIPAGNAALVGSQSNALAGWPNLRSFLCTFYKSPLVTGPLKAVVDEVAGFIETYESAARGHREYVQIRNQLEYVFKDLEQHLTQDGPRAITTSMKSLCSSIMRELDTLKQKEGRGALRRYLEAGEDLDNLLECYGRIQGLLQRLSLNANLSMWRILEEHIVDARLRTLCPTIVLAALYNSAEGERLQRGLCTPGTCVAVLSHMHEWIHDPATDPILWLNGMAGTGKTTILYTLCAELEATSQLSASYFCSRLQPGCQNVDMIIPCIAYQLAQVSRPFKYALSEALKEHPFTQVLSVDRQLDDLLVKPLTDVRSALPKPLIVAIDAPDECDTQQSPGRIVNALRNIPRQLPIKIILSGRPEPEIRDHMDPQGDDQSRSRIVLHELDRDSVQRDIELYIRVELKPANPSEKEIATLVQRAGVFYIYAATAIRYIGFDNFKRNPRARLEMILNSSTRDGDNPFNDMDNLYATIMKAAMPTNDSKIRKMEWDDTKQVLNTVLCAPGPLTVNTLSELLEHDTQRVHTALRPLWSVLHITEKSGLVAMLNSSFSDYLFDLKRSKEFYCDPVVHHRYLTRRCFEHIKREGKRLPIPVDKSTIPAGLSYAYCNWASHLEKVTEAPEMAEQLEDFLLNQFSQWTIVMDLEEESNGYEMLQKAKIWCIDQGCPIKIVQQLRRAQASLAQPTTYDTQRVGVGV